MVAALIYCALVSRPLYSECPGHAAEPNHATAEIPLSQDLLAACELGALILRTLLGLGNTHSRSNPDGGSERISLLEEIGRLVHTISLCVVRAVPLEEHESILDDIGRLESGIAERLQDVAGIWAVNLESKAGFLWIPPMLLSLPSLRDRHLSR